MRIGPHADGVQLQRGHAEVVKELPQFRQLLHQRRDDALRRIEVGQGVGHHERLEPGERIERDARDQLPVQLLDVDAAVAAQSQGRGAKARAVGDGEVDLALGRHRAFEGDAVGLGGEVAGAVLDEIEPLFLFQGGLEIGGAAEQAGLALLAHAALEDRLDEDRSVAADQRLDLVLARRRAEDLRRGMARELEQPRAVQHAGDLHCPAAWPSDLKVT